MSESGISDLKNRSPFLARNGLWPPTATMNTKTIASRDAILQAFDAYRTELDEQNDRRERIIKVTPAALPTMITSHPR